jgi:hypothetical protein
LCVLSEWVGVGAAAGWIVGSQGEWRVERKGGGRKIRVLREYICRGCGLGRARFVPAYYSCHVYVGTTY